MKNLDVFSKRVLVLAVSISMVLLSASAFLKTIQPASAQTQTSSDVIKPLIIGLGYDGFLVHYLRLETDNKYHYYNKEKNPAYTDGISTSRK